MPWVETSEPSGFSRFIDLEIGFSVSWMMLVGLNVPSSHRTPSIDRVPPGPKFRTQVASAPSAVCPNGKFKSRCTTGPSEDSRLLQNLIYACHWVVSIRFDERGGERWWEEWKTVSADHRDAESLSCRDVDSQIFPDVFELAIKAPTRR